MIVMLNAPEAAATAVPRDALGVNVSGSPSNLSAASGGVGVVRTELNQGADADAVVTLAAEAHLRLYPMLGLPASNGAAADASAMAQYVSSFARYYGPGGSFWAVHPELPYLPVQSFEIGNEPDITPTAPMDGVSLHYERPSDYALVYEAARAALHRADPAGRAVVGGVLDSDTITLSTAERYLAAIGPMDAVGFHPYLYGLAAMEGDTVLLRWWLDIHGHSSVPLDINEFGAFDGVAGGMASWGAVAAAYSSWALCTPVLRVENVQPFWWGDVPRADTYPWYALFAADGSETPLGSAYLHEAVKLTTGGCPTTNRVRVAAHRKSRSRTPARAPRPRRARRPVTRS